MPVLPVRAGCTRRARVAGEAPTVPADPTGPAEPAIANGNAGPAGLANPTRPTHPAIAVQDRAELPGAGRAVGAIANCPATASSPPLALRDNHH
ncbi:hypothetical protein [Mycobacterium decipiens]|uniref:hypothetical protein n=1 Tax=Mycobacterium decipiens TaxID=1430326 RepID=UPI0013FE36A0|nr:hypothetical protein [Mycobacterium decipiens]